MKDYTIEINLKFAHLCLAKDKKEALALVKASFFEDYGIELEDDDIVSITSN